MPDPSTHAPGSAVHTDMYGGDVTLSFDEGDHEYFARSEKKDFGKVVSSTQALDKLAKPGLRYWAVNETIDYIENRWDPGQEYDEIEIDEILSDAKNARFKSSGRAKKIGSVVHEWIEEYVQANAEGRSVTVIGPKQGEVDTKHVRDISLPYNEKAQDAIKQFLSWTEDHEITWLAAEQKAFSHGKGYAGTYDADAVIDGKRTLIDWKTSKRIYDEYPLQAAAYVYAREEESAWKAKRYGADRTRYGQMMILRVPKTGGEFEIWQEDSRKRMARLAEVFQSLLDVYKWDNE